VALRAPSNTPPTPRGSNGLLLINLTLTQVDAATGIGESVNLSQQIRIDNAP
jgi:hypothetical protein